MQTRSATKYQTNALYTVNIDFDEASSCWKANKKSLGNGTYQYICCATSKTGTKCRRHCIACLDFCRWHRNN